MHENFVGRGCANQRSGHGPAIAIAPGQDGYGKFRLHKMEKNPTANRTWKIAKTCFQKALKDVESINKLTTGEVVITDNEVIKSNTLKIKYALRSRISW